MYIFTLFRSVLQFEVLEILIHYRDHLLKKINLTPYYWAVLIYFVFVGTLEQWKKNKLVCCHMPNEQDRSEIAQCMRHSGGPFNP